MTNKSIFPTRVCIYQHSKSCSSNFSKFQSKTFSEYSLNHLVNPLPSNKTLDLTKLKATVADKLNAAQIKPNGLDYNEMFYFCTWKN